MANWIWQYFVKLAKKTYGTAIHAIQNEKSNLIFSKQKLALNLSKTLPTLELLAVYFYDFLICRH